MKRVQTRYNLCAGLISREYMYLVHTNYKLCARIKRET